MTVEAMVWLAIAVIALPFVLLLAFNGRNVADARGRRISRRWRPESGPQ